MCVLPPTMLSITLPISHAEILDLCDEHWCFFNLKWHGNQTAEKKGRGEKQGKKSKPKLSVCSAT